MVQIQYQEQKKYIEDTLNQLTESFEAEEIIDLNDPETKKILLNLVRTIKDLKEKELAFYNDLLNEIPQLKFFEQEAQELTQTKYFLSNSLTSNKSEINSKNFAELMKSSTIYYFINTKTQKNLTAEQLEEFGDIGLIKDYLQAIWPSAKQEELLGLLLYINSGQATKDYLDYQQNNTTELKEMFLYNKFRESLHDLHVELEDEGYAFVEISKSTNKNISVANKMDAGCVLDEENKKIYIGFATAKYDTTTQNKQYFEKIQALKQVTDNEHHPLYQYTIVPAYITNSLLNENDLKDKEREQKKEFLSHFSEKLTKEDKNKMNCLSFLSLVKNLDMSDINNGLDIKDILLANPYVSGADTLWIYKKFQEINKLSNEEQYVELRKFLLNEARNVLTILNDKIPDFEFTTLSEDFQNIFISVEKLIYASLDLFNTSNMDQKNLYHEEFINDILDIGKLYKSVHTNKFNMAAGKKNVNLMQGKRLYNLQINKAENIIAYLDSNNETVSTILENQTIYKDNSKNKLQKYKEENSEYTKEIESLIAKFEFNIFKKPELINESIEEILCTAQLNPSRDIKKILGNHLSSRNMKNFIQNAKYWEKNKDNSYKNMIKNNISEIVFNYALLPNELIEKLKEYSLNEKKLNKNKEVKNRNKIFSSLATTPQRMKIHKQLLKDLKNKPISLNQKILRFKNEYFKPFSLPSLTTLEKENLIIGYLKVKAEMIKKTNGNSNSVWGFNQFVDFVNQTAMKNDPEFHEICDLAKEYEKNSKLKIR